MLDLELLTPPTAELVTLDQAKAHLEVRHDGDDEKIRACIAAAMGHLDGYAGILGRALAEQEWKLWLDRFPVQCREIRLPLPPLISVSEIAYTDTDGAPQVLTEGDHYQVFAGERASVAPAYGTNWPTARCAPRSVSITFTCGWVAPEGEALWPPKLQPIIAAAKLLVGDFYLNREAQTIAVGAVLLENPQVKRLIQPLRIPKT